MIYTIFTDKKLRKRCLLTILVLLIIRLFYLIPMPGVNRDYFNALMDQNSIFGILNIVTGNGLSNLSIMALSIGPYITATIVMQLLTEVSEKLKELRKGRGEERKRMEHITLVLTVVLAMMQSAAMAWYFGKSGLLEEYHWKWILCVSVIWTVCSTVLAIVGKRMGDDKRHFIGNGVSLILLFNIVSSYPGDLRTYYYQVIDKFKGNEKLMAAALSILGVIVLFSFTAYVHSVEKRIDVVYSGKLIPGKDAASYIPIKLCPGSVIPIIFASSILSFVALICGFTGKNNLMLVKVLNTANWFQKESPVYTVGVLFYILLIFLFSFYYTEISINPEETADTLRKNGGNIPDIRSGRDTAIYLRKEMRGMIMIGAVALTLIAVIPIILSGVFHVTRLSFIGTSIIITVSVILETKKEVLMQSHASKYTNKIRNGGLFKRHEKK